MLRPIRLPFRLQVPLGLTLAVLLTATAMAIGFAVTTAQRERAVVDEMVQRAQALLMRQALPLIWGDDVWGLYELLRDTSAVLAGGQPNAVRMAVLDTQHRVVAASDPATLPLRRTLARPSPTEPAPARGWLMLPGMGSPAPLQWLRPITTDDGQLVGHLWVEVNESYLGPAWTHMAMLALSMAALALVILLPVGWAVGRRMARPVVDIARCIDTLLKPTLAQPAPCAQLPVSPIPEIERIAAAVRRLAGEIQARMDAEQRALSAERLAALGRLTSAVAHEVNNPLSGLMTAVHVLHQPMLDDRQRRQALDLLERGLRQLQTVVAALLPHARGQDGALTRDDLHDVLVLAQAAAQQEHVDCQLSMDEDDWPLQTPATPWRQAMLNLLLNAIRAAGPGGWVRAHLDSSPQRLVLHVTNSGARLDPDRLHHVLHQESGADPRGYGLWICQQLATRHGGGFGCAQSLDLPLNPPPTPGPAATHLVFWLPRQSPTGVTSPIHHAAEVAAH